jgi:hypothetical protein
VPPLRYVIAGAARVRPLGGAASRTIGLRPKFHAGCLGSDKVQEVCPFLGGLFLAERRAASGETDLRLQLLRASALIVSRKSEDGSATTVSWYSPNTRRIASEISPTVPQLSTAQTVPGMRFSPQRAVSSTPLMATYRASILFLATENERLIQASPFVIALSEGACARLCRGRHELRYPRFSSNARPPRSQPSSDTRTAPTLLPR